MNADSSSPAAHSSHADTLSPLVAALAPQGRLDLRCLFGRSFRAPHGAVGPWRAPFHVVLQGRCELELPAQGTTLALEPGTLVLLPRGTAHVLRAGSTRPRAVRQQPGLPVTLKTNLGRDEAAAVEVLCGEFEFAGRRRSLLLDALPEALAVPFAARPEAQALAGLVRLMAHEVERPGAGSAVLLTELAGALFTLLLRAHLETAPLHGGVLALMRSPRLAPALQAMLERPQQPWTVASLAALCHLSRAGFARQFVQQAGTGPLALLTTLRMDRAAQLLAAGRLGSAAVGEAVGYASEAAFHRAFVRHSGQTPARYRRTTQTQPRPR